MIPREGGRARGFKMNSREYGIRVQESLIKGTHAGILIGEWRVAVLLLIGECSGHYYWADIVLLLFGGCCVIVNW